MMTATGSGIRFACTVLGRPAPQGSKRYVGKGRMVESSAGVEPWREAVAMQVAGVMRHERFEGFGVHVPVTVSILFHLRRPVSLPRKITRHVRKPDLDKLVRATLDAMVTARLIADDGQVWEIRARKVYAVHSMPIGAVIEVECGDGVQ